VRGLKSARFPRVCGSLELLAWTETRPTSKRSAFESHYLGEPKVALPRRWCAGW
jgi:hypothetical protein